MPDTHDCPPGRCTICDQSGGDHKSWCKRGRGAGDRPVTSAQLLKAVALPEGDVCGPFSPDRGEFGRGPIERDPPDVVGSARLPAVREPTFAGYPYSELLSIIAAHKAREGVQEAAQSLPTSALARKELPLASGLLDYFPAALIAVAGLSRVGNEQHNPGQPMHWARGKSGDEADALLRHLVDRGTVDTDGIRHSVKVAWRALALLQKELEAEGLAPLSRGSRED